MKKTIVCLKWGNKYSSHYVNVLYNMCKRNCTVPFSFICLTDCSIGLLPEINIKPLPNINLHTWWYKLCVFDRTMELTGNILFLDLDLVVYDNIDKLWDYKRDQFIIIRDFTRHMSPGWKKFNSSVFRFSAEDSYWIWDKFFKDYKTIITKNHGDQDYLYNILKEKAKYWPDNWIQSYKWEMRDKIDIQNINGKRNFTSIQNPRLTKECSIAVFHGEPNPHDVKDPWVIENWK